MSFTRSWGLAALLSLTAAVPGFGQFNAILQWVIQDTTGVVVSGAQVSLQNNGTQAKVDTTSNDQGFYRFNQLPSGAYTLTVSSPGFSSTTVNNVSIAADVPQSVNATLQPASVESSTTVTANAEPTLQTADASKSGTISSQANRDRHTF